MNIEYVLEKKGTYQGKVPSGGLYKVSSEHNNITIIMLLTNHVDYWLLPICLIVTYYIIMYDLYCMTISI